MRQARLPISALISLLILLAADSLAQARASTSAEYGKAIHAVIHQWWGADSYSSELAPSSSCTVRIVQLPGGEVISVDPLPNCDFDEAGRRGVTEAVQRASPLPYYGFENFFQREIRMTFHSPSVEDRKARASMLAETERARETSIESDKQWAATVGARRQHDEYIKRCSFHLLWEMPKVQLQRPITVIVTVDRSGNVVGVTDQKNDPVNERVTAALGATPPCDPIPSNLVAAARTIEIGPITIGDGSD